MHTPEPRHALGVGVVLLTDHARRDKPVEPRHCACRGCRLGHVHNSAVTR